MYNPIEPKKCPKCGGIVKVDYAKVYLSNPPKYQWTCPDCGETGFTEPGDVIVLENYGNAAAAKVGVATNDGIVEAENIEIPKSCNIPAPQFIQQGWECPKCGAILAPNQSYCPFCSKKENDWITTVGTGTQPFYSERTQKDNLTPQTGQYTNPNTNNNNTAPSAIPDYRPFCSPSEYGRTNWLGTNTPTSGQYTNPNTGTTISLGDKPKVPNSDSITFTTPCEKGVNWKLEQ